LGCVGWGERIGWLWGMQKQEQPLLIYRAAYSYAACRLVRDYPRTKGETRRRMKAIDFLTRVAYVRYRSDRSIEALAPTALPRPQGPSRDAEIGLTAKAAIE
jgi:hypothetical protein